MTQYRKTPRAQFLDYDEGDYFITICTHDRKHYFGEIYNGEMYLSEIGEFCKVQIDNAHSFNDKIDIVVATIMPNHIHFIVHVDKCDGEVAPNQQRCPNPSLRANSTCQRHVPTLSRYISSLKGAVTKFALSKDIEFRWQGRYYDHLIRGERDEGNIYNYIIDNVSRWEDDCFRH